MPQFNDEAWVRLPFIHDLVIPCHQFLNGHAASGRSEFAHYVKVKGNELFDFENIDSFAYPRIRRKTFRDLQTSLESDQHGADPLIEIVSAVSDYGLVRGGGYVYSHISQQKVRMSRALLIGIRKAGVLNTSFTQRAVQFCANKMLKYRAGIIDSGRGSLSIHCLGDDAAHHRTKAAGRVGLNFDSLFYGRSPSRYTKLPRALACFPGIPPVTML